MWLLPMFVSPRQFRAMIHGITPLGDALTTELEEIFAEALCSVSFDVFSLQLQCQSQVCKKQTEAGVLQRYGNCRILTLSYFCRLQADFPDFLLLLRKLLDCNFASIKAGDF